MKKILIADDEPDILKIVTFRLAKAGYDIVMAVNGREALEKTREIMPDLVLLDVSMPLMKGDEVCRRIKADDELKSIPVVMMTASTQAGNKDFLENIGADDYILKPFQTEDFLNLIKKHAG